MKSFKIAADANFYHFQLKVGTYVCQWSWFKIPFAKLLKLYLSFRQG
jgi:hypothetical protein